MQLCMPTFYLITSMKELHFESLEGIARTEKGKYAKSTQFSSWHL